MKFNNVVPIGVGCFIWITFLWFKSIQIGVEWRSTNIYLNEDNANFIQLCLDRDNLLHKSKR